METLIIGGDARMPALAALLNARHTADAAEARALLPDARTIVANNPAIVRDIPALAAPNATICLCGPKLYAGTDPRVIDLWRDEQLLRENAYLTAEGALSAAMRAGDACLCGLPCAVIGWGRIGSALAELLVAIGAKVTVISRTQSHRNHAIERGAEAASPDQPPAALEDARLIFSTPPANVLDAERLKHVRRDAMIIDLASPPYGVDLTAAWKLGLRAWREPGLPGRYCPESAALALLNAIKRGRAEQ